MVPEYGADARKGSDGCGFVWPNDSYPSGLGPRGGPCMFPAEHYKGGIILGAQKMLGENLAINQSEGKSPLPFPTPGKVPDNEDVIGAGVNNISVSNGFYVYKTWKYYDERTEKVQNAYVWIDAAPAKLKGSDECDGKKKTNCDLYAKVGEFSARSFKATVVPIIGWDLSFSEGDYWLANPQEDTHCNLIGALLGNLCLKVLNSWVVQKSGLVKRVDATLKGIKFRLHDARAVKPDGGNNKMMIFEDLYAEVRYGDGNDRVHSAGVKPIKDDTTYHGQTVPIDHPNRTAGLSNPFPCEGNPNLKPNCGLEPWEKGKPPGSDRPNPEDYNQSYIDIYRGSPPVNFTGIYINENVSKNTSTNETKIRQQHKAR
ncbi:MAG: hypothetical protein ABEK59_13265 [Halobacteria archaeon]